MSLGCYAIVAAVNPPTLEPKLIREYIALPEIVIWGLADWTSLEDEDLNSDTQNENEEYSSEQNDQTDNTPDEDQGGTAEGESSLDENSQENYDEEAGDAGFL